MFRKLLSFKNAPATFRRALDIVITSVKWRSAPVNPVGSVVLSKKAYSYKRCSGQVSILLQDAIAIQKLKGVWYSHEGLFTSATLNDVVLRLRNDYCIVVFRFTFLWNDIPWLWIVWTLLFAHKRRRFHGESGFFFLLIPLLEYQKMLSSRW